jgi:hypothetical protein
MPIIGDILRGQRLTAWFPAAGAKVAGVSGVDGQWNEQPSGGLILYF